MIYIVDSYSKTKKLKRLAVIKIDLIFFCLNLKNVIIPK